MGTIPTITTFASGAVLTAAMLNQVKTVSDFWSNPPQCFAYAGAAQTLTTSTAALVALNSELFDIVQSGDSPSHDNVTNNSRVHARTSGKYQISAQCAFVSSATGGREVEIRLNAAGSAAGGSSLMKGSAMGNPNVAAYVTIPPFTMTLTAGDYIELFATQYSGGNLDTVAGSNRTWVNFRLVSS